MIFAFSWIQYSIDIHWLHPLQKMNSLTKKNILFSGHWPLPTYYWKEMNVKILYRIIIMTAISYLSCCASLCTPDEEEENEKKPQWNRRGSNFRYHYLIGDALSLFYFVFVFALTDHTFSRHHRQNVRQIFKWNHPNESCYPVPGVTHLLL